MNRIYLLLAIIVTAGLSGCGTTPHEGQVAQRDSNVPFERLGHDIQSLLSNAKNTTGARADDLRLRAAKMATENGNLLQAETILSMVDTTTDATNARRYALLQAEISIQREDAYQALEWLNDDRIMGSRLTQLDQVEFGRLRARAYYVGRSYIASARERVFFDPLLSLGDQKDNHKEIFSALMELPANTLSAQAKKAITSDLRGWLSLAAMTKQFQNDPHKQLNELNRWKTAWSNHPAIWDLPASLTSLSKVVENQPKVIALLLPIQGSLGTAGRSIRDGIIAARFKSGLDIKIDIYDTSNGSIQALVNEAAHNGAELIIGPLDRSRVTQIAEMQNLPVPVLALNRAYDDAGHQDLYQFGLAPEDEMVQVAEHAFMEGKRNVLAIYPDSNWGKRNHQAFTDRWIALGGNIVGNSKYQQQKDYSDLVKSALEVDRSESRAKNLRRILGERFEFTPRRRQDIDFVFLLANQNQARGINPTLAFFYAEDIPVYSTSHIYAFDESKVDAIDLNGIMFCDIPWKLTSAAFPPSPVQSEVQLHWANANSPLAPFYALGVDAFQLYPRLQQLKQVSGTKIFGLTGILQLTVNNVVVRKLMWAHFSEGQVVRAPVAVEINTQS